MNALTVATYIVQVRLSTGWTDAAVPMPELADARRFVREGIAANPGMADLYRVIERRVTTIDSVLPS